MGLIGAALGAAGSIAGGIASMRAANNARKMVEQEKNDNQNWYDRRFNEDATQKADAQRILSMTEESIKNRNKQAAGSQAVMGGTDESTAAAKAVNNQALSDATGTINALGERQKSRVEDQYQQNKSVINKDLENIEQQKAQDITGAINGVTDAAGNLPI